MQKMVQDSAWYLARMKICAWGGARTESFVTSIYFKALLGCSLLKFILNELLRF